MNQALSQKAYKGWGMEGFTAKWYASLTRNAMDDFRALAKRVAEGGTGPGAALAESGDSLRPSAPSPVVPRASEELPQGARVLEVAPGPGYFAIELAKIGSYRITGLDISRTFVEIARRNAADARVAVEFRQGDAANMPFANESFDFVLCRAAFKNFNQPLRALQEMERVLDTGGRAMIIDLRGDASRESVNQAVNEMHLGPVNRLLTKGAFHFMLLKRAYTKRDFEQFLSVTKFGKTEIHESRTGFELVLRK